MRFNVSPKGTRYTVGFTGTGAQASVNSHRVPRKELDQSGIFSSSKFRQCSQSDVFYIFVGLLISIALVRFLWQG